MAVTAPPRPPRAVAAANAGRGTSGTWRLVRFLLRRDRVKLPAWVLGITVFVFYFNTALPTIAPSEDDLAAFRQFADGPVGALLAGPGYGFDADLTYRVFFVGTYGLYFLLAAALMNILLVTRHTRVEEQTGRAELVRASVIGRNAPLTATLVVAALANVALAALIGAATASFGYPVHGSLLFGAGVGAVGLAFAGVTAVTVQVTEYSRAAAGLAGAVLGAAYLVRAAGDSLVAHGSLLSWFSPLAWSQQTRAFVDERWWPLLLSLGFAAVTAAVGFRLAGRRDIGAALRAQRPGPAGAAPWLRSPAMLALRLQRASLLGWGAALALLGLSYGALVGPMTETFTELSTEFAAIIGGGQDLLNGYLSFMAIYHVALVGVFAILAVQGLRAEETKGRAEPVLATAVSRTRWFATYLAVAAAGAAALLAVAGLAFGLGAAISLGDAGRVAELTVAHLARLPEVLVFMAVAALLYGLVPRAVPLSWAVLVYAVLLTFFGPLLDLPAALYNLSPLDHIGRLPLDDFSAAPAVVLTAVAAVAVAAGLGAYRRRDLAGRA
jgi:ABC-2 type transport system permease protein